MRWHSRLPLTSFWTAKQCIEIRKGVVASPLFTPPQGPLPHTHHQLASPGKQPVQEAVFVGFPTWKQPLDMRYTCLGKSWTRSISSCFITESPCREATTSSPVVTISQLEHPFHNTPLQLPYCDDISPGNLARVSLLSQLLIEVQVSCTSLVPRLVHQLTSAARKQSRQFLASDLSSSTS